MNHERAATEISDEFESARYSLEILVDSLVRNKLKRRAQQVELIIFKMDKLEDQVVRKIRSREQYGH